jgi:hypothetical protein
MKAKSLFMLIAVIGLIAVLGTPVQAQCDRQCLEKMMKDYLAAMVKHDPSTLPFASNTRFTENSATTIEVLPIGKGLWETASAGPSDYQIYAADPVGHSAACLVMMKEKGPKGDQDIYLGARIKLNDDGKISEAEHIVVRGSMSNANLKTPRPGLLEDVAPADRMKHWELVGIGLSYYDALTGEDGTLSPMANDCERHENGMLTAGGKPTPQDKPIPSGSKPNPEMEKMMKAMGAFPRD